MTNHCTKYKERKNSTGTDESKIYRLHKSHENDTNECIHLKNASSTEDLIKKGRLGRCAKDDAQKVDSKRLLEFGAQTPTLTPNTLLGLVRGINGDIILEFDLTHFYKTDL